MKYFLLLILPVIITLLFFAQKEHEMFMFTPINSEELDQYNIPSITKRELTSEWLSKAFSIKENNKHIRDTIFNSIQKTSGPCPCPYLLYSDKTRRCGGNSSYSKGSGKDPFCYPLDIIRAIK